MEEPQKPPADKAPEEGRSPERQVPEGQVPEEQAQERIQQLRYAMVEEGVAAALAPFQELHPADQGELVAELPRERQQQLLEFLTPWEIAQVLGHMDPDEAAGVSRALETPVLSLALDAGSPDVAADIVRLLPPERAQEVLGGMQTAQEVTSLLQYPDESAGGLMTPEYPVVRAEVTAAMALDGLRLLGPQAETVPSFFVVAGDGRLVGSLGIARLALARPTDVVGDIMDPDVRSVSAAADQEECARLMERYDLRHLPVVDPEHRLVGVILVEDVVDVVEEEATEDMYKMIGMGGARLFGPLRGSVRHRLPWLYVNLVTTLLAALVISLFESTIDQVVVLAVFLPVVAGQGGIGGTQTLTLVVRGMALGELLGRRGLRLLGRELLLGLLHGLLLGVGVGALAYAWKGSPMLGVVLGLAMLGNMLVGGLAGAGIPLVLRWLRMDPAVASAVIVTTFTDILGFLMFLGLATLLLRFLL